MITFFNQLPAFTTSPSVPIMLHRFSVTLCRWLGAMTLIFMSWSVYANENALVCSTQLGNSIPSCPINKIQYASAFSHIPEIQTSCESSGYACYEAKLHSAKTDYFTFFDIDSKTTVKYAIEVAPKLLYSDDSVLQQGGKDIRTVTPTEDEVAVTERFNDVLGKKDNVDRMLTMTQNPDGSVVDENGNINFFLDKIKEHCQTAIDYRSTLSGCASYLNQSIDQGAVDNALFYALIDSLEKLQTVINIVIHEDFDLSNLDKLSTFNIKLMMNDGSVLTLIVEINEGVVNITLNNDGSRTSTGRTFYQAFNEGIWRSSSLGEAETIGNHPTIPILCKPVNLSTDEYRVVTRIIIRKPDGTERTVFIYAKDTYFYTYQSCE